MRLYETHVHLKLCILTLLSFRHVAGQACSSTTSFSVNATGSQSLTSPFKPPTGPLSNGSSNWIWNIATESYPASPPNLSVRQALWLDIQPPQDLLSPELGYLGCGLIAHGLKTSITQHAQNDDGTCGSVLNAKCIAALLNDTTTFAPLLSASEAVPIEQICRAFATQQGWKEHGVPSDCSDAFSDQAWVETLRMHTIALPFPSPQPTSCTHHMLTAWQPSLPHSWYLSSVSATPAFTRTPHSHCTRGQRRRIRQRT